MLLIFPELPFVFYAGTCDVRKKFYVSLDYFMYQGYLAGHFHTGQILKC